MSAVAYGIPLALVTTSAFNTGLILEKRALATMPALNLRKVGHAIVSLLSNPAWLAGFALMLTGLGCQVIVLAFEPISLVQPILASGRGADPRPVPAGPARATRRRGVLVRGGDGRSPSSCSRCRRTRPRGATAQQREHGARW